MQGSQHSGYSGGAASFSLLIVGETGRGKTRLTARMANSLAQIAGPGKVTLIDMAPDYMDVGKPATGLHPWIRVVRARTYAPRLMSQGNCEEAWRLARLNAEETSRALRRYLEEPTPVLVINDLSIHLHSGDLDLLREAIRSSTLFIGNSYLGTRLRDECGIWDKELKTLELVMEMVNAVWRL